MTRQKLRGYRLYALSRDITFCDTRISSQRPSKHRCWACGEKAGGNTSTLNQFLGMIFLPIPDGGGDGHVTRIGPLIVLCQFFGRAVAG